MVVVVAVCILLYKFAAKIHFFLRVLLKNTKGRDQRDLLCFEFEK